MRGPISRRFSRTVEQAEASEDLEEKITAAPDTLLVAVPLPPAPEPAQTPVPVQDGSTEPESSTESGSSANSNVEAAAVPRPQAYPQPASGWEMHPMTSQPQDTVQSPDADQQPVQNPGIGKERAYTPIQENTKQPIPSPDLRPARPTATPTNDLFQTLPQGSAPDVLPSIEVGSTDGRSTDGRSTDGGGEPTDKIGRNPTSPDARTHGFSQEVSRENLKPAPTPAALPGSEPSIEALPKGDIRPVEPGLGSHGESGTPVKTAEHGPKQGRKVSSGERPYQQPPVLGDWNAGTVLDRQQTQVNPQVDPSSAAPATPDTPVMVGQGPEPVPAQDPNIAVAVSSVNVEKPQTRLISEYQGETDQAERPLQQVTAEEKTRTAQPTDQQQTDLPAPLPKGTLQEGRPVPLEQSAQSNQSLSADHQTPVNTRAAQTIPVRERPTLMASPETHHSTVAQPMVAQPTVVDGSHQSSPGEPSELPENQSHLPRQQAMPAAARETQTPSNGWPTYELGQAAVSAERSGTGPVLTHPLTSKPEAYPVNVPAETIFPADAPKLPETNIPAKEMPTPAPIQTPTTSLAEFGDGGSSQDLAQNTDLKSAAGLEEKMGIRKAEKGDPRVTDPPKMETILRGEIGHSNNLTKVEVPQPVIEPARLAEAHPTRLIQQLQHQVLRAAQAGKTSLHLQLHPENLGQIDLELTSRLDGLRITFTPDNPETGKLLAFHLKDLQQSLTEAGVQISGLSIGQDQTNGTARQDTWRGAKPKAPRSTQPGNGLKITDKSPAGGRSTGSASAVDYQI